MEEPHEQEGASAEKSNAIHPVRLVFLLVLLVGVSVLGYQRWQAMREAALPKEVPLSDAALEAAKLDPPDTPQMAKARQTLDKLLDQTEAFLKKHDRWPGGWSDLDLTDPEADLVQMGFGFDGGNLYTDPDYLLRFVAPADYRIKRLPAQTERLRALGQTLKASFERRQLARPEVAQAKGPIHQTSCPFRGLPINRSYYVDHEGLRIYTCCTPCLDRVKKDPALAIANLKSWGERVLSIKEIEAAATDGPAESPKPLDGKTPPTNNGPVSKEVPDAR